MEQWETIMPQLKVVSDNTGMVLYETMCKAIADCYRIDEVKDIRDRAIALEKYSQQAKNKENERLACEIRLRAERKAGELLAKLPKAQGARFRTSPRAGAKSSETKEETLKQTKISRQRASDWERTARIPKPIFEKKVKEPNISSRKMVDYAKTFEPPKSRFTKPKPKWSDPHLDAQIKLNDGLVTMREGLKKAVIGMKYKDQILELMNKQGTDLPSRSIETQLRAIKTQLGLLAPLWLAVCPCPYKNSNTKFLEVKETINV